MWSQTVPRNTIYRLSSYADALRQLAESGTVVVSSSELATLLSIEPAKIRKDLAHFGQFGKRGTGYHVIPLQKTISRLLGTQHLQRIILVGAGNLGCALLAYNGLQKAGFEIIAAFDTMPKRKRFGKFEIPILHMRRIEGFIRANHIRMAILCVPAKAAQNTALHLVEYGIQAILNFAPVVLNLPAHIKVNTVNFAAELEHLNYFLQERQNS